VAEQGHGKVQAIALLVVEAGFLAFLAVTRPFRNSASSSSANSMLPAAGINMNMAWIVMVSIQVVAQALLIVFLPGLQIDGIAKYVVAFSVLKLLKRGQELIRCAVSVL
jgi:hypothetical protein